MKLQKPTLRLSILAAISLTISLGLLVIFELNAEELRLGLAALYVLFVLIKSFTSAKALDLGLTWLEERFPPAFETAKLRVTSSKLFRRFKKAA